MVGQSFLGHIGIGKETTWGNAVPATDYFEALSEGLTAVPDRFETRNIIGGMYEPDDEVGVLRIAGDIEFAAHPVGLGIVLNGVFGQNSGSVIQSGELFLNEFIVRPDNINSLHPLPSYTMEMFRDIGSSQQYDGVQFTGLTMAVQPNQDLRCIASVVAKGTQNITKTVASFPGSPVGFFQFDTASISLGGVGVSIVEAITIGIDNQLEGQPAVNASTSIARVTRTGPPLVRVSGTIGLEDIVEYQKLINQTEQSLVINMTKANSFALIIDCPRIVYDAFPLGMPGRERQTIAFSAIARYHTGSASSIKVSLTTTKSDY